MCASTGLLEALSREEVAGVMAHELAHIKNHDTLTMTVAATIGGAISMLAQYLQFGALFGGNRDDRGGVGMIGALVAIIVAPLAAMLVQMAISRSREYQADRMGAQICGQPLWLASALRKIQHYAHRIPNEQAEAAPATAHLFIINPLSGTRHGQPVLDPPQHREPHRRAGGRWRARWARPWAAKRCRARCATKGRGRGRRRARATLPAVRGAEAR